MSRFNHSALNPRQTVNHENAKAYYALDPEQQLYSITACNMLQDTAYSTKKDQITSILNLVPKCDPFFVAKLAEYLRHEMYLRSTPILLLAALAYYSKLSAWMVPPVIRRADEIKELLSAWLVVSGKTSLKKLPNALKKGIALSFNKFTGYHFRKYNKQGKESISFKDAMYVTHPCPNSEEKQLLFKQILNDELDPILTWETQLSASGNDSETTKAEVWEKLITEGNLPYMAALRNMRNILNSSTSEDTIKALIKIITNREAILKSKQFPFRWFSAAREIRTGLTGGGLFYVKQLMNALEEAITISIANIPGVERFKNESTLVACDVSGSMMMPLSDRSKVQLIEVGILLGKMLNKFSDKIITGVFGSEWAQVPFGDSILQNQNYPNVGYATFGHKVINWLTFNQIDVDNIMFFSDMQIYSDMAPRSFFADSSVAIRSAVEEAWNKYKGEHPATKMYLFDLSSYSTYPIDLIGKDIYMVCGWSPNIFKVLDGLHNWKVLRSSIEHYNISAA